MLQHVLMLATPVYVTAFWAIVFFSGDLRHNKPRLLLGVFMFVACLLYVCHALFFLGPGDLYLAFDSLYLFVALLVYPLFYWYIRLLTIDRDLRLVNLVHFIPALALFIFYLIIRSITHREDVLTYQHEVLMEGHWQLLAHRSAAGWLAWSFLINRVTFTVQVVIYGVSGFRLASQHNEEIKNYYSNLENRRLVWVKMLTVTLWVASLMSLVFNFLGRSLFFTGKASLLIPSLLFSSLLFFIGLQGNRQGNTAIDLEPDDLPDFHEIAGGKSMRILGEKLEKVMLRDRIYLIPDLKITTVCKLLNTNRTYISSLINEQSGQNFNMYVNRHRIEYAIELMKRKENASLALTHIAQESGFGSISSFIRAFKAVIGETPGQFLQKLTKQS